MEFYFKKTYNQGPLQLTSLSILNPYRKSLIYCLSQIFVKALGNFPIRIIQNLARALTSSPKTDGGMARVGQWRFCSRF